MAHLIELDGVRPTIGPDVYLAPTAVLVGDVRIGARASVWFGAVLRGDLSRIEIGERCSVQDNVIVHCAQELPTIVGDDVVLGHAAMLEGCVVEDGALIGMGAIVLQRAHVGAGAVVAAGGVVVEGQRVSAGIMAAGVPVRERKPVGGSSGRWGSTAIEHYQELRARYLSGAVELAPEGSEAVR